MRILGIETSCDETAAAVLEDDTVLSGVVSSQVDIHREYGGVVPELASREHVRNIGRIIEKALKDADTDLRDIGLIAVTRGPGLVGALLVGLSTAKAVSYALNIPLVPVNHIQGHLESIFLTHKEVELPALSLVVSGGHTSLYYMPGRLEYSLAAQTRDDALGEAYDKVARLLGLGYPGGPIIEKMARSGDPKAVNFPVSRMSDGSLDFSFSGIKTAVLRYIQRENIPPAGEKPGGVYADIAASFQHTAIKDILGKCGRAFDDYRPYSFCVSGGVSINEYLRKRFRQFAAQRDTEVYFPDPSLTTDNAVMIAYTGYLLRNEARPADPSLNARASLEL